MLQMTSAEYRETALLACALMLFICLLGTLQILQNTGVMKFGASSLRRLYRANKLLWVATVPTSCLLISFTCWRLLLLYAPADTSTVAIIAEALVLVTFFAGSILHQNLQSEAEKFKQAGQKLEQFIEEMKSATHMSQEDRDRKILEARLTALEVSEMMGQKPSNDTWLDSHGDSSNG